MSHSIKQSIYLQISQFIIKSSNQGIPATLTYMCVICYDNGLQIRSSMYALISAYCQTNPGVAVEYTEKICPLVLHNLDESEPLICPRLWEAVLYTIKTIEVKTIFWLIVKLGFP